MHVQLRYHQFQLEVIWRESQKCFLRGRKRARSFCKLINMYSIQNLKTRTWRRVLSSRSVLSIFPSGYLLFVLCHFTEFNRHFGQLIIDTCFLGGWSFCSILPRKKKGTLVFCTKLPVCLHVFAVGALILPLKNISYLCVFFVSRSREPTKDGVIATFDEHEDSVYAVEWSTADPWVFASLSYDGRLVINRVPRAEKYKILLQSYGAQCIKRALSTG